MADRKKTVTLKVTLVFPKGANEGDVVERLEDLLQESFDPGVPMEWPEVEIEAVNG